MSDLTEEQLKLLTFLPQYLQSFGTTVALTYNNASAYIEELKKEQGLSAQTNKLIGDAQKKFMVDLPNFISQSASDLHGKMTGMATDASAYLEELKRKPDLSAQTKMLIDDALEKIKEHPGIAGTALAAILLPIIYSIGTKYMRKRASSQRRRKQSSEEHHRRSASKRAKANNDVETKPLKPKATRKARVSRRKRQTIIINV